MSGLVGRNVLAGPARELRGVVSRYDGFAYEGSLPVTHHAVATRYVSLVISLGGPIEIVAADGRSRGSFHISVGGLHTRPMMMRDPGRGCGVIVQLEALGVCSLLGVPAAVFANEIVDLGSVWGRAVELQTRLSEARTWPNRFGVLDEMLVQTLRESLPVAPEVRRAWSCLVASNGTASIATVAGEVGWSRRHLLDGFRSQVGLAPKQLARVLRLERASSILESGRHPGLATVAAACGFYDQSHLAGEWRALTGMTITEWLAQELRDPLGHPPS